MSVFRLQGNGGGDAALGTHEFKNGDGNEVTFRVTRGDYSPVMKLLVDNLAKAKVIHAIVKIYITSNSNGGIHP